MDRRELERCKRFLRANTRLPHPVRVTIASDKALSRRHPNVKEGVDGDCRFVEDRFLIAISETCPDELTAETLIHEWAHAINWHIPGSPHHSRVFQAVERRLLKAYAEETA